MPWYKPEEKLPEHEQKILFFTKRLSTNSMGLGVFLKFDEWDRRDMFCDGSFFYKEDIAYWMPAPPNPPSEEPNQEVLWQEIRHEMTGGYFNFKRPDVVDEWAKKYSIQRK
jgi:hypothetical protein